MISISKNNIKTAGVVWGISLLILAPIYMYVLRPQKEQVAKLNSDIEELQNRVSEIKIAASDSARESLKKEVGDLKGQLDEFVVKNKDDIQNLASIEIYNIAKELGLDSFRIDPWNGVEVAAFNDCKYILGQTMIVGFNSDFNDFAKFVNRLERYKKAIFIDSFSITRSYEETKKPKIEINLAVLLEKTAPVKGKI